MFEHSTFHGFLCKQFQPKASEKLAFSSEEAPTGYCWVPVELYYIVYAHTHTHTALAVVTQCDSCFDLSVQSIFVQKHFQLQIRPAGFHPVMKSLPESTGTSMDLKTITTTCARFTEAAAGVLWTDPCILETRYRTSSMNLVHLIYWSLLGPGSVMVQPYPWRQEVG